MGKFNFEVGFFEESQWQYYSWKPTEDSSRRIKQNPSTTTNP